MNHQPTRSASLLAEIRAKYSGDPLVLGLAAEYEIAIKQNLVAEATIHRLVKDRERFVREARATVAGERDAIGGTR